MVDSNIFSKRIKERRKSLKLTLEDVGNSTGVTKATVQRWESGTISNIRREKIEKIAEVVQCQASYLMGWTDSIDGDCKTVPDSISKVITLMELLKPNEQEQVIKYIQFIISSRN